MNGTLFGMGLPEILAIAVLYVANLLAERGILPGGLALDRVMLDPAKVMQGEVWRLATFLFTPPSIGHRFEFVATHLVDGCFYPKISPKNL